MPLSLRVSTLLASAGKAGVRFPATEILFLRFVHDLEEWENSFCGGEGHAKTFTCVAAKFPFWDDGDHGRKVREDEL